MRVRGFALGVGLAVLLAWPATAMAGMPSVNLSDWVSLRLETISFCLVVFLLAAGVVRWLWNLLARDFPRLPRLSYGRTLAALALWSAAMGVVLTMIAGSRELLTPGAWQKQGLLYKVAQHAASAPTPDASRLRQRQEHLRQLQLALWRYAAQHAGQLPAVGDASIDPALWEVPGLAGMRYGYVAGKTVDDTPGVLAYEPEVFGPLRCVLCTNSELAMVSSAELRRKLSEEKQP